MKSFTKYILGQHTGVGVEVDGMWQALFVTFLVYAMMPLKTWIAVAFSTMIAGTHITVTSFLDNTKIGHHWQQVRARKLKKSRPKKLVNSNKSISRKNFLTNFHFLQFQKWPKINF